MTESGQRQDPADRPVGHRYRRSVLSGLRARGSWVAAALGALDIRRPTRREWLVGAAALALVALLGLGGIALRSRDRAVELPPRGAPSGGPATSAPTAPPSDPATPSPSPSGTPAPSPTQPPSPSPTGGNGDSAGGGRPAESGVVRPEPRQVGPVGFDAFERFLSDFCQDRGERSAVLLDGPDGRPQTGDWVCVQVVTFTAINLDDACRTSFGEQSQARRVKRGDSRTWRCFDR